MEEISEVRSHSPFEVLKHNLWLKKWMGVKLVVWFFVTKKNGQMTFEWSMK
jgi:hypothetical protein